jgi:hypothetical protein
VLMNPGLNAQVVTNGRPTYIYTPAPKIGPSRAADFVVHAHVWCMLVSCVIYNENNKGAPSARPTGAWRPCGCCFLCILHRKQVCIKHAYAPQNLLRWKSQFLAVVHIYITMLVPHWSLFGSYLVANSSNQLPMISILTRVPAGPNVFDVSL